MNNRPEKRWRWRLLRWGLIGMAVLATLVAVLITEENWRGKRDWEVYKRDAEARGERFDWSAFAPTNVPDDQNFVKAPIFSNLWATQWDEQAQDWKPTATNTTDRLRMSPYRSDGSSPADDIGSWARARLTRLENWQEYYRNGATNSSGAFPRAPQPQSPAADVLLALSKYASALEELRLASQRPFSRTGVYSAGDYRRFALLVQYLARLKGCSQVLNLRAIAELNDNQNAPALDDIRLLLRLVNLLRQEPLLIDHLVGIAITAITLQPIYEGLAQHRWNEAQLAELDRALATEDFLADYRFAMRGERTLAIDSFENQRITRKYKTVEVIDGKPRETTINMHLMPSAYFYQNELTFAQMHRQLILPLVDLTNRIAPPAALRQAQAAVQAQTKHYSPYKVQALMLFPAVSTSVIKFANIQTDVDLARVACALERYRLAHGEYPKTLDALAPQFNETLPHDVINGQPLHYRRADDGQFVLYSVGWNEKDDGGTVVLTKVGTVDRESGDWVWQYPAK